MYIRTLILASVIVFQAILLSGCLSLVQPNSLVNQSASNSNQNDSGAVEIQAPPANFLFYPPTHKISPPPQEAQKFYTAVQYFVTQYEREADASNNPSMQYELGLMYNSGVLSYQQKQLFDQLMGAKVPHYLLKTKVDLDKTLYWMDKAIRNGSKDALQFYFTFMFNRNLYNHYPKIKKALQYAANNGDNYAKATLGLTYLDSKWGAYESSKKALEVFRAYPEEPASLYGLGIMYLSNRVIDEDKPSDSKKAILLLEQASNLGYDPATSLLAGAYLSGLHDVPEDFNISMHYFMPLLKKFPFHKDFVTFAIGALKEQNSEELDQSYSPLAREVLLNNAFIDNLASTYALGSASLFAAQNRLNLNFFDALYFHGYEAKLGKELLNNDSHELAVNDLIPESASLAYQGLLEQIRLHEQSLAKVDTYESEAKQGDFDLALFLIFYNSRVGRYGVPQKDKAIEFANILEKSNNPEHIMMLGMIYLIGIDLPTNEAKGLELLRRAEIMGAIAAPLIIEDYLTFAKAKDPDKIDLSLRLMKQISINYPMMFARLLIPLFVL